MTLLKKEYRARIFSLTGVLYALFGVTCVYVALYILPALYARLTFIGELDFQESVTLNVLRHMDKGGNIYQPPDVHFAGMIYAPFYSLFAYAYSEIMGLSFFSLRLLSLISIVICAICSYIILYRTTTHKFASLMWLPLFLVLWPFAGWIDLGRLEAFYMMLLFAGFASYVVADGKESHYWMSGIFFGLAMSTKQPALLFLPMLAFESYLNRKAFYTLLAAALTAGIIYGGSLLAFGATMLDWVFFVPKKQDFSSFLGPYLTALMGVSPGVVTALIFFLLYAALEKPPAEASPTQPTHVDRFMILRIVLAGIIVFLPPFLKIGAVLGNFVLLFAFASLAICWFCGRIFQRKENIDTACAIIMLVAFLSFIPVTLANKLIEYRTPREEDARKYKEVIKFVKEQPGDIWVMCHPWVSVQAGKEPFVAFFQAREWVQAGHDFDKSIEDSIKNKRFSAIIDCSDINKILKRFGFKVHPANDKIFIRMREKIEKSYKRAGYLLENQPTPVQRFQYDIYENEQVWVPR